ncbi:tol-pal system-associated acyl-CoA thioesterase [Sinimarinibacterium sp. CAU 1509]|uniref:tol-pal system-associated acyl-CoA thioesterase n=1 Tax=Sinimarinibacterium sp. CAU 1509 TaxID=2562283 RepID=UPI0010AD17F0|nr:tol-pal system-associated acyl-CoA thioesterase [Sinimarinibacterium sp. CAU 1509]TJY60835.1 tol-pal system-associated acyl-CoA thioesterase [Sinimarinibacterium sp. CAU 1509]
MSAVFRFPIRVYYEDTDASGVAYHAGYLRWFERARTEWLRALGLQQDGLHRQHGVVFTVAHLDIAYRRPARLDQLLEVHTRVAAMRRASLMFEQTLVDGDAETLLARAMVKVGCVDAVQFRPIALPQALFDAVARWTPADQ